MAPYLLDWLSLLLRWAHVIVGIAWIGASLYFIWLDDHLEPSADPRIAGELWAVHGGGFYRAERYRLAPPRLPAKLHWFKWEAYWTWLTGFALLVAVYYVNAQAYLIDPAVMPLSRPAAIGIGIAFVVGALAVYEGLCRSPLGRNELVLGALMLVFLSLVAFALTRVFSGRGAFIHYGAILGTIMVGNVAHVIIPGQRRMVQAMREGRAPDAEDARRGKQRSVHNTYFTLPVVFTMIANHHAIAFGHAHAWLVLVLMTLAGALVRVWFVMRHRGRAPAWALGLGLVLVVVAVALLRPGKGDKDRGADFGTVRSIVDTRCAGCHSGAAAQKGVRLDSPERLVAQAAQVRDQVMARAMPPGNATGMTDEERRLLDGWVRAGARADDAK